MPRKEQSLQVSESPLTPVYSENLNPDVVVMKSAKDRIDSCPLNRARDRRIFIQ